LISKSRWLKLVNGMGAPARQSIDIRRRDPRPQPPLQHVAPIFLALRREKVVAARHP
jgi:hypothetical protein